MADTPYNKFEKAFNESAQPDFSEVTDEERREASEQIDLLIQTTRQDLEG